MAASRSCQFRHVCILQGMLVIFSYAVANGEPTLDMRLTRQQITTSFGQPANLGCYTNHTNSSSLKYSWTKDNVNVTPSSNINVYDNVLVVTPENNSDFGTYECHVSNGVTTTSCSISLQPGCNKTDAGRNSGAVVTGCVNLSVLMPVLTVMVVSLLLNAHFLIQWRRRQVWLRSEEDFLQLQMLQRSLAANHEEQVKESSETKKKKMFGGGFKKRQKEYEESGEHIEKNGTDSSKHEKNKEEEIEMQVSTDFSHLQESSHALDSPREQESSRALDSPREQDSSRVLHSLWEQNSARTNDSQEIPRLEDIYRVQDISPPTLDSLRDLDSPRSLESPRTKEIPCLKEILREQDSSSPTQDSSRALDSPRSIETPRTSEIPRLEDFLREEDSSPRASDSPRSIETPRASEIPRLEEFLGSPEIKDKKHDQTAHDSSDVNRQSAVVEAPRIASFFFPGDESDNEGGERQSLNSEQPLVSHYMEKMNFEKGNDDDEHDEEPLVSHYMEKMDFSGANDDEEPVLK